MSDSTTELRSCGQINGFDLYYNPINRRMICERKSDLATALFDYPSCVLVHNWGASKQEIRQLREYLEISVSALPTSTKNGVPLPANK